MLLEVSRGLSKHLLMTVVFCWKVLITGRRLVGRLRWGFAHFKWGRSLTSEGQTGGGAGGRADCPCWALSCQLPPTLRPSRVHMTKVPSEQEQQMAVNGQTAS